MLKVGDLAPEFFLEGSDGQLHSLAEFRGFNLVLYFYPRDNTTGCTIEAKEFNAELKELEKKNAVVVGISSDGVESHKSFKKKQGLDFLLLSDPQNKVTQLYDSYGKKGVFGMGTLRKTFIIGKAGNIKKIYEHVTPIGHGKDVLSCIE